MGSVEELKDALKETLERTGVLRKLQGRVRSEVFQALSSTEESQKPEPSNETLLINEVVREYLIFNGYRDTLSVFLPESGQPPVRPFDRAFLAQQLNLPQSANASQLPLLYGLVAAQQQRVSSAAREDDRSTRHTQQALGQLALPHP